MALTVVSTDSTGCWTTLRNTVGWLEDTSVTGPARAMASEIQALASRAPAFVSDSAELRAEEDNLRALLGLLNALA